MSGIVISGNDKASALFFILISIFEKILIKIEFVLKPFLAHLAVREINVKKYKIIKIHLDNPTLAVEFRLTNTVINSLGLNPGIGANPTVSFFYRGMGPE